MRFKNNTVVELVEGYKPIWALNYAGNLMGWDSRTYMPKGSAGTRGIADAQLELISQKLFHDPKFSELLRNGEGLGDLNDYEKGVIRVLAHRLKIANLPSELLEKEIVLFNKAYIAWESAKKNSDFASYMPYLEQIIEIQKDKAEKLGYADEPYDALLDLYEEGALTKDTDRAFSGLVPGLKGILDKVESSGSRFTEVSKFESMKYDTEEMKRVNEEILKALGFDYRTFRVDLASHPFTMPFSSEEVRMTTRYLGSNFKDAIFPLIHEAGHSLHFLQLDPELNTTPLSMGYTLGIAESQSKFFEAIVGRSREFVQLIMPMLKKNLSLANNCTEDEIYYYFNTVIKGPIRVQADELTYNFHIALRYELERLLVNGEIKAKDLPEVWNNKMDEYLGIRPKNDAEGVLQDSHWSSGFGYFPTYTLGNIASGIIRANIRNDIRDFDQHIRDGNFAPVRDWLREKVHQYGTAYTGEQLLKKSFNEGYDPKHFLDYLRGKYLSG
ncbi:MAG: carboxypeptidase M32 [Candidatus Micrarchaeota archaeon]|nr:carboxypeptidase M32 [Candidatus Micrarchaeota archaeon]